MTIFYRSHILGKACIRAIIFDTPDGQPYEKIHYIISGIEMHYSDHENGKRKIISFHGAGTVFPGYRQNDYKIELSEILGLSRVQFTRGLSEL